MPLKLKTNASLTPEQQAMAQALVGALDLDISGEVVQAMGSEDVAAKIGDAVRPVLAEGLSDQITRVVVEEVGKKREEIRDPADQGTDYQDPSGAKNARPRDQMAQKDRGKDDNASADDDGAEDDVDTNDPPAWAKPLIEDYTQRRQAGESEAKAKKAAEVAEAAVKKKYPKLRGVETLIKRVAGRLPADEAQALTFAEQEIEDLRSMGVGDLPSLSADPAKEGAEEQSDSDKKITKLREGRRKLPV